MIKKPYFEPVDAKPDFSKLEKKLLKDWYRKGVVAKYLSKNKNSKKFFSFLDGPITANNPMGVHHAWGRTYKDLWQRFKNMQGYRERFQNGFDCQGLWVEVEVEKELGFKSKKDIEKYGVAKFVARCRQRVAKYSKIQTDQSKQLGYFMDWDHSYYTLSDDNNYMIWYFLKKCYEADWLYKGKDSVPWCPRCETAISQHEMLTEDYKESAHEAIYLAYPQVGRRDEHFLIWTTTPWTIPANIAVAVDTSIEYSLVSLGEKRYWVAKDAVARVFAKEKYRIEKTVLGAKLVGLKYKGPFDDLPAVSAVAAQRVSGFHSIVPTDNLILPVTTSEGTGMVHTAVSAGMEDFKLGQKLGLPMIPVIKDDASYMENLGFLSGQNAKDNPRIILDFLLKLEGEGKHFVYKIENYTHRYPACWRCKTELVWKVTDEWYIAMDKPSNSKRKTQNAKLEERDERTLRERMTEVAKKIKWIPEFGLDRELDWLANMHDWLISKKNRYWGLALPIWECPTCASFEVIGSKEELKEKAVAGIDNFEGKSPHKPQIDLVKIKCEKCGEVMSRVEPVGNPWLDAGIIAFSTVSEDNQASNFTSTKTPPLYLNDKAAWENWFPADFITESFPGQFKNWFYSLIAMSTVLEDREPFRAVLGHATLLAEDGRPMHKSWGNAIEFGEGADTIGVDVMRWMYARQNPSENLLFAYRVADETRRRFHLKLWNVYNFLITYANLDAWRPKQSIVVSRESTVLDEWILVRLNQTVNEVTGSLENFDAYLASSEVERFVDDLSLWYIRRSRNRVGPGAESERDKQAFYVTAYSLLLTTSKLLAPFTPFLAEVIYRNLTKKESVHLADWPKGMIVREKDTKILSEMAKIREIAERAHAIRKEKGIPVRQPLRKLSIILPKANSALRDNSLPAGQFSMGLSKLLKDELNVKEVEFGSGGELKVNLDSRITKELEEEGKTRELVRKIQDERKKMGMNLTQRITVENDWIPLDTKVVHWLLKKTVARDIHLGKFKIVKVA